MGRAKGIAALLIFLGVLSLRRGGDVKIPLEKTVASFWSTHVTDPTGCERKALIPPIFLEKAEYMIILNRQARGLVKGRLIWTSDGVVALGRV